MNGFDWTVSESPAASGPHVWLDVKCPAHLTAENAWRLAEQLMTLVRDHHQGDARPDVRSVAEYMRDQD